MLVDPPSATKREKRGFRKEGEERPKAKKDPKKKKARVQLQSSFMVSGPCD